MNWEEIKKDVSKIHPKREIAIYTLQSPNRKSLGWVNIAYANYDFREFCRYCVEIQIRLGKRDKKKEKLNRFQMHFKLAKIGNEKLDFEFIENYFIKHFSGICTALFLYIKTTKRGFQIQIYVDNIEATTNRLNEMKTDKNRIFDFDYKITEDENWDIIGMMLY